MTRMSKIELAVIKFDKIAKKYERLYKKLQNVFADLGGLLSSFILIGKILICEFNKKKFDYDLINYLFEKPVKEENDNLNINKNNTVREKSKDDFFGKYSTKKLNLKFSKDINFTNNQKSLARGEEHIKHDNFNNIKAQKDSHNKKAYLYSNNNIFNSQNDDSHRMHLKNQIKNFYENCNQSEKSLGMSNSKLDETLLNENFPDKFYLNQINKNESFNMNNKENPGIKKSLNSDHSKNHPNNNKNKNIEMKKIENIFIRSNRQSMCFVENVIEEKTKNKHKENINCKDISNKQEKSL